MEWNKNPIFSGQIRSENRRYTVVVIPRPRRFTASSLASGSFGENRTSGMQARGTVMTATLADTTSPVWQRISHPSSPHLTAFTTWLKRMSMPSAIFWASPLWPPSRRQWPSSPSSVSKWGSDFASCCVSTLSVSKSPKPVSPKSAAFHSAWAICMSLISSAVGSSGKHALASSCKEVSARLLAACSSARDSMASKKAGTLQWLFGAKISAGPRSLPSDHTQHSLPPESNEPQPLSAPLPFMPYRSAYRHVATCCPWTKSAPPRPARPPTLVVASSTTHRNPRSWSRRAQARPARPAPITTTSADSREPRGGPRSPSKQHSAGMAA
mmetsp:Transcript_58604/g.156683  ORF Transcript_58604/g.156683 Transcript_58604/m.156683 type:complete len:326 (-) Transcript_58604:8-985(-)